MLLLLCVALLSDCQGFSAGLSLMYMSEEEAFWMLHCISRGDEYLLNGLCSPGFPLLFQYFAQFAALLAKHCPRLSAHFAAQKQPITPELYATQWFMTLFSCNLPFELVLRIWDILLTEGPKIVFRLAIFFRKHLEARPLAERDFATILDILKSLHRESIMQDSDAVIEGALKIKITQAELVTGGRVPTEEVRGGDGAAEEAAAAEKKRGVGGIVVSSAVLACSPPLSLSSFPLVCYESQIEDTIRC